MARKGQFKKGGGRHGGGGTRTASRRRSTTTAIVIAQPRSPARRSTKSVVHKKRHGKRRRHGGGGHAGVTPSKIAAAALVLGSAAGTNNGPLGATVYDQVQKLPGAKTFGGAATAGLYLGAIGKFTGLGRGKAGPWLKVAGIIGLVGAFLKIGEQGASFKWLGGDTAYDHMMGVEG